MKAEARAAFALRAVDYDSLNGWADDDHLAALQVFRHSLDGLAHGMKDHVFAGDPENTAGQWRALARAAWQPGTSLAAMNFFESHFIPHAVRDAERPEGLFTGYYEPQLTGSRSRSERFPVPVYERPADLAGFTPSEARHLGVTAGRYVDGQALPYDTRQAIETGSLENRARVICWLSSWVEAYFLHVQGSGRVKMDDGAVLRLGFAAKSGHPYRGIGKILIDDGLCRREDMSMQFLKAWMNADMPRARAFMWRNPSYIFFRELSLEHPELGAIGAAGVQLTPGRSLAIDPAHWPYGLPAWLELDRQAPGILEEKLFRRLLVMQDKGSAIMGAARGDIYFGWGKEAEHMAGHLQSPGKIYVLLPRFMRLAR